MNVLLNNKYMLNNVPVRPIYLMEKKGVRKKLSEDIQGAFFTLK